MINTIVYAGRIKDKETLLNSSSGGAFTAISDYFLNNGDAVVCAVYDYEKDETSYRLVTSKEVRDSARGSKYMQSKPYDIFSEAVNWLRTNPNKNLLFVGMGCQAEGFRKYTEQMSLRDRVYLVDIICHGSPSPLIWKQYSKMIQHYSKGRIQYVTFKDKRKGWLSPTPLVIVNEKEHFIYDYVTIFYNRCALRPSCHVCPFATTERATDITIGDFWHIEKTIPDFFDSDGTSVFLVHTEKGMELFQSIAKDLDFRESNVKDCWQRNLEYPTPVSEKRDEFWSDYQAGGIEFVMKKYASRTVISRIKNKIIRVFFGGATEGNISEPSYADTILYEGRAA